MKCKIMLGLLFMSGLSIYGMDLARQSSPFALGNLRKYIMVSDDGLMRVVFPDETFNTANKTIQDPKHRLDNLFKDNPHIIIFNDLYKITFLNIRHYKVRHLQNQWLKTHISLHDFIVKNAIAPALQERAITKNLGDIDHPESYVRQLMQEYVEFFFFPLKGLSDTNGASPFAAENYYSDDRCPTWLRGHLNVAINHDKEMDFFNLISKLESIKNKITKKQTGEYVSKISLRHLKKHNYTYPISKLADKILITNKISLKNKNYTQLKDNTIQILLHIIKSGNHSPKDSTLVFISDNIFHSDYWNNDKIIFILPKKQSKFALGSPKSEKYKISVELLIEILAKLAPSS